MRGFLRRLSGSKDPEEDTGSKDSILSVESLSSKKRGGLLFRRRKTPSSPARLVTQLYQEMQQQQQESPVVPAREAHQRSFSAQGLKRGQPNTIQSGLPSPAHRRSLDSGHLTDAACALDTSPILRPDLDGELGEDERGLPRQTSRSSVSSGAELDHAFIQQESLLGDDSEERTEEEEVGDRLGMEDKEEVVERVEVEEGGKCEEEDGEKTESSVDHLEEGSPEVKEAEEIEDGKEEAERTQTEASGLGSGHRAQSIESVDSGLGSSVASSMSDLTHDHETTVPASKEEHQDEEGDDVAQRRASPLRFPNSTSRRRRVSPIRIPSIFVRADAEAMLQQQQGRQPSPTVVRTGSMRRPPLLPISTRLVRSVTLSESDGGASTNAGHTPRSILPNPPLQAATPLRDASNEAPQTGPRLRPQLLASKDFVRLKSSASKGSCRSPVKSVKRLGGSSSPHSPRVRSPARLSRKDRLSPLPNPLPDWNI